MKPLAHFLFVVAATLSCDQSSGVIDDAGNDAQTVDVAIDAPSSDVDAGASDPCTAGDPQRLFWNDFEDGRFYADGGSSDPTRDFVVSDPTRLAIVDHTVMSDTHDGARVLRGNFWEWTGDGGITPVYDPLAADAGIEIRGAKSVPWQIALNALPISQTPSADASAPTPPPGELYVSFWVWYDIGFSRDSTTGPQAIKLFYAFGPNGIEWVVTDEPHFFINLNNLAAVWPAYPWGTLPHPFEGRWTHVEWHFRSETHPVFYEYGQFSKGGYLASACPDVMDYMTAFPVPGMPGICLTPTQALAANSQDGTFTMKLDGAPVYAEKAVAWNGRFNQIRFPAFHGGGGDPIASAGWAVDDVCVRSAAPPGFE